VNSEAARAGVEPGMIVLAVDGGPLIARLADTERSIPAASSRDQNLESFRKKVIRLSELSRSKVK